MNEQPILETPKLRAEMERLRPVVGQAVEDVMKSVEAAPIDALWVLIKAMTFVMGEMGHDDIADALVLVFQRKLEWPRVPSSDARSLGPIGDALWETLDMGTWSEFEGEDDLEFGRRSVVILGVLIEIITDVIGQIWGPEKEQYIMGILEKASEQSLIKAAKITLPADDAVSRRKQSGREKLMSNDMKRCGGWEEPCDKPATRIFEARGRDADGFGEEGWHTVRLCEHHYRAFFQKNEEEGFVEVRFR